MTRTRSRDLKRNTIDFDNTLIDYIRSDIFALTQLANTLTCVDANIFVDRAVEHIMAFIYRLSNTVKDFGLRWEQSYLDIYLDYYLHNLGLISNSST